MKQETVIQFLTNPDGVHFDGWPDALEWLSRACVAFGYSWSLERDSGHYIDGNGTEQKRPATYSAMVGMVGGTEHEKIIQAVEEALLCLYAKLQEDGWIK